MRTAFFTVTSSVAALLLGATMATPHSLDAVLEELDPSTLGEVNFATSCNDGAQAAFEVGLLLLHHMMYRQSDRAFQNSAKADPDCSMAQWGIAMTKFHPLWPGGPSPQDTEAGQAAAARLSQMDPGTEREAAYIEAVLAFYDGEERGFRDRLASWAEKQRGIDELYPGDHDAAAFDALAQLTVAPLGAAGVPDLRDAGQRMDALRRIAPRHPGSYHYAIHAYDHPALAERGLEVSRGYDRIAPEVPHALHMPSHIFTRLGLWQESAEWNARSAAAVLDQVHDDIIVDHYPHAIDYAVYAHLQTGDVGAPEALLTVLGKYPNLEDTFGSAYATSAAAARIALETEDWAAAANLPADLNPAITWDRFPQALAMRWFAKGIGAARAGDTASTGRALRQLSEYRDVMTERGMAYWVTLTDAQIGAIEAWNALNAGDEATARSLMTAAADAEDAVGKAPVTPGHVLPARELLGDLLMEIGDPEAAAQAYEASLAVYPNRARSVAGLARASGG